jgi:hypothetical protein
MVIVAGVLLLFAWIALFALFAALPTMLLWNWLMPVLFHLPEIGFWQAVGLLFLCGFLFKSSSVNAKKA